MKAWSYAGIGLAVVTIVSGVGADWRPMPSSVCGADLGSSTGSREAATRERPVEDSKTDWMVTCPIDDWE